MPDRWTAWCRDRVPEPARSRIFDPAAADLARVWLQRPGGVLVRARRRAALLVLAWQCRRLARQANQVSRRGTSKEQAMMWWQDIRIAGRRLRRQPAFLVTAAATLALGIGPALAVASYVHAFLLAPVNAPSPDDLFRVVRRADTSTSPIVSWPLYQDVRDQLPGADLAAHSVTTAQAGPPANTEVRVVELVSGNYFRVLQQRPSAGRLIGDQDNLVELAHPVAVLGYDYWRQRFSADTGVVGSTLIVNGAPVEIIGVAAEGFRGTFQAQPVDFWIPITMQQVGRPRGLTIDRRGWGWLRLVGRREAAGTLEVVQAQLDAAADDVNRREPPRSAAEAVAFQAEHAGAITESERAVVMPMLTVLLAFTGLLFIVTCANLAGLMQARILARRRELAVRESLGAGRGRLVSAWLTECLLVALGGGALGLLTARLAVVWIGGVRPPEQLVGRVSLASSFDWSVALYALGLSIAAAAVFGLLPAWRTVRGSSSGWLRDESRAAGGSRATTAIRRTTVVAQLAVSGVLLLAATLLGESLLRQTAVDPGFDTSRLAVLTIDFDRQRVPEAERSGLLAAARERIRRDPDVRAAEGAMSVPLGFGDDVMGFRIDGHVPTDGRDYVLIDFNVVGAGYFEALGAPLVSGRPWAADLSPGAAPVVVINETMARRFWNDRDPVGQSIGIVPNGRATIVGVVRDVAYYEIGADPIPYLYVPAELRPPGRVILHVRTAGDPGPVIARLAKAIETVDPRLAATDVMTFEELRRVPLFTPRLLAIAASVFGALSVLLAGVGLFGVVTMSVGERTREIGVRMALGARPDVVLRGVLGEAMLLAGVGLVLALVAGYLGSGVLSAWLFQTSPFDVSAYGLVVVLLVGLALVAAWVPARRAARIDPVAALRQG